LAYHSAHFDIPQQARTGRRVPVTVFSMCETDDDSCARSFPYQDQGRDKLKEKDVIEHGYMHLQLP